MNQLIHADCLDAMKLIQGGTIDMILCDLPYGHTKNKWDTPIPLDKLWQQYERIIKPNGAIVLFGQGLFSAKLMLSNEKLYRYSLVWQKTAPTNPFNAKKMPMRYHEDILVFYKKLPIYNAQKTTGHQRKVSTINHKRNSKHSENYGKQKNTHYDSTERYPKSVFTFSSDKQKKSLHPTQKPVDLLEYLIKTYSNEGNTVLDNCAGSGSSGEACNNTNRNYILIEKEEKYIQIIQNRLIK